MLRKAMVALLALLTVLVVVVAANTLRKGSRQIQVAPIARLDIDEAAAAERLAEAVRLVRTISSRDDAEAHADQFRLHDLLRKRFPRVHAALALESVGGLSLLYTWRGTDAAARPALLMAHQDVVPVAPGTDGDWQQPPFSGRIVDGYVWGRGSWDDKGNLMAQLEAVERLLAAGFRPARTVYLAFGADEEVGGARGAGRIADLLAARGVKLDFVLDEGLLVLDGVLPGLARPAALIGIAEKGYLSLTLRTAAAPGHSSMPPPPGEGAIAMLAAALGRLDAARFPAEIAGVAGEMFDTLAPEMSVASRVVLSNLWLFGPLVRAQLERAAGTNAVLRTTTAITMLRAGDKENVLPGRAEATLNFRLLPGDTPEAVTERVRVQATGAGPAGRIEVSALPGAVAASKVAPTDSPQYRALNATIREVFPDAVVAPGLMVGGTDSMHFDRLSGHVFKFSPVRASGPDLARFHGTDERLGVANYADAIRFYHRLIERLGGTGR